MTTSAWTEDRIGRLKSLWREGRTADQIARELQNGISRSAVLGKVFRLGLSATRSPSVIKPAKPTRSRSRSSVAATPVQRTAKPEVDREAPSKGLTTILSVRRLECRWPYGEPGTSDFTLCGRRVTRGAFCAAHAGIGYQMPKGGTNPLLATPDPG